VSWCTRWLRQASESRNIRLIILLSQANIWSMVLRYRDINQGSIVDNWTNEEFIVVVKYFWVVSMDAYLLRHGKEGWLGFLLPFRVCWTSG
jgi:hypothetical protein